MTGMKRKTAARFLAIQGLYNYTLETKDTKNPVESGPIDENTLDDLVKSLLELYRDKEFGGIDIFQDRPNKNLIATLINGVFNNKVDLDKIIDNSLREKEGDLERMLPLQHTILQLASFELSIDDKPPAKTILNEYVTLAHMFLSDEEAGFVSGILNDVARALRTKEFPH